MQIQTAFTARLSSGVRRFVLSWHSILSPRPVQVQERLRTSRVFWCASEHRFVLWQRRRRKLSASSMRNG